MSFIRGLLVTILAGVAGAQTVLTVPGQFGTIQAAITAAGPGDIIDVAAGTYVENIDFSGKNLTLRGATGPLPTILDGGQNGSVVTLANGESATLSDLVITNGSGSPNAIGKDGGGIFLAGSTPLIRRCVITGNCLVDGHQTRLRGAGIFGLNANPTLEDCVIGSNSITISGGIATALQGGGCAFTGSAVAHLIDCDISNNVVFGAGPCSGGGVYVEQTDIFLTRTLVSSNLVGAPQGSGHGAGVFLGGGQAFVTACRIVDNSNFAAVQGLARPTGGGGVYLDATSVSPLLSGCVIARNSVSTGEGGGVFSREFSGSQIDSCTITANSATAGGGIYYVNALGTVIGTITNSIFWANTGGSIQSPHPTTNLQIHHCDVDGGWPGLANINVDPLFHDAAVGDYRLNFVSPCIDAAAAGVASVDVDGDPRPFGVARDIGADEFFGPGACGASRVGAGLGGPHDILSVNGSTGGPDRRVVVGSFHPISIDVAQSPSNPAPMHFYVAGYVGVPAPGLVTVLPAGLGDFCFPLPLLQPGFPGVFNLTSNFGPLPGELVTSTAGSWSIAGPGFPTQFAITFQGIVEESPGVVKVTNAVVLDIRS